MTMNKTGRKPLKLLVIGAHPADSFDNAGGTCLHHTQQGDSVTAVILLAGARIHDVVVSDGMRSRTQIPQEQDLKDIMDVRSDIKKKEVKEACAIMGINDVRFFDCDDYIHLVKEKTISDIACLIREIRPDIVITHYPFDNGGYADQHAITGQCVLQATWVANTVAPDDPNPQHKVAQLFFFGFPSTFAKAGSALYREFSGHCAVFVDVSDVIHLKIQALDKMQSQQYDGDCAWKRVEAVEGSAGFGASPRVPYAEPFIVAYSDVYHTLPVSDFRLQTSNEPERNERDRTNFVVTKYGSLENYQAQLLKKYK
ncbi:MAG: hypothetical protein A2Y12_01785 [Planctomycetes bacterium GWF2_42_9]|nr:MAG: hypothetical protein A2Y12_01785 [Planctomycetes bacterium GWF2_42_9]